MEGQKERVQKLRHLPCIWETWVQCCILFIIFRVVNLVLLSSWGLLEDTCVAVWDLQEMSLLSEPLLLPAILGNKNSQENK